MAAVRWSHTVMDSSPSCMPPYSFPSGGYASCTRSPCFPHHCSHLIPPQVQRQQLQAVKQAEDDARELLEQQLNDARQAKMAAARECKERERRERALLENPSLRSIVQIGGEGNQGQGNQGAPPSPSLLSATRVGTIIAAAAAEDDFTWTPGSNGTAAAGTPVGGSTRDRSRRAAAAAGAAADRATPGRGGTPAPATPLSPPLSSPWPQQHEAASEPYMVSAIALVPPPDELPRLAPGVKSSPSASATGTTIITPAAVVVLPPRSPPPAAAVFIAAAPLSSPPAVSRLGRGAPQPKAVMGVVLVGPQAPADKEPVVVLANR